MLVVELRSVGPAKVRENIVFQRGAVFSSSNAPRRLIKCTNRQGLAQRVCRPDLAQILTKIAHLVERIPHREAVMLEDAPLIPLYVLTQKHLIKPYVRDYAVNLLDLPPLWRIWIDPGGAR